VVCAFAFAILQVIGYILEGYIWQKEVLFTLYFICYVVLNVRVETIFKPSFFFYYFVHSQNNLTLCDSRLNGILSAVFLMSFICEI
jgi:hypothetical protein